MWFICGLSSVSRCIYIGCRSDTIHTGSTVYFSIRPSLDLNIFEQSKVLICTNNKDLTRSRFLPAPQEKQYMSVYAYIYVHQKLQHKEERETEALAKVNCGILGMIRNFRKLNGKLIRIPSHIRMYLQNKKPDNSGHTAKQVL